MSRWRVRVSRVTVLKQRPHVDAAVPTRLADETCLQVRSIEAPDYVPSIQVEVRYCRKAGRNYLIGCRFCSEIPWNVRVWFG